MCFVSPLLIFHECPKGIFQACRGWTIATFQHITDNDFLIRLLGANIEDVALSTDDDSLTRRRRKLSSSLLSAGGFTDWQTRLELSSDSLAGFVDDGAVEEGALQEDSITQVDKRTTPKGALSSVGTPSTPSARQRRLYETAEHKHYNEIVDAGVDVFFTTAGAAALESAIPATVRIVSEGYISTGDDNIELTVAVEDMAGLLERNGVGNILRGAVLSPALTIDTYFAAAVSNLSPLFKLPVDAIQRGRDHGLPSYNAARKASGAAITGNRGR